MLTIVAIAIQFVMVTAYAWSAASTTPRNVPVAITGPEKAVSAVTGEIELSHPGAFRLIPAASPQQAKADITGRQAYGAIVLTGTGAGAGTSSGTGTGAGIATGTAAGHVGTAAGRSANAGHNDNAGNGASASSNTSAGDGASAGTGDGASAGTGGGSRAAGGAGTSGGSGASVALGAPEMLVASGASPAVANILTNLASHMSGAETAAHTATVRDIVPSSPADPNGTGFAFTVLPIAISSLAAGGLLTIGIRRRGYRTAALIIFGVGGGLATAAVAHTWLGIIPGDFPAIASVTGLTALAVAAAMSGLGQIGARWGRPHVGLALGGALIMLVGNPFSGAGGAPEMLPGAWGMAGQCLPNGALATLLRSVAYFGGARSAGPWAVLAAWTGVGLLLTFAIRSRQRPRSEPPGNDYGNGSQNPQPLYYAHP
ncbi:MAG TPA: ABC transporter permease [Trebonia sp.]